MSDMSDEEQWQKAEKRCIFKGASSGDGFTKRLWFAAAMRYILAQRAVVKHDEAITRATEGGQFFLGHIGKLAREGAGAQYADEADMLVEAAEERAKKWP